MDGASRKTISTGPSFWWEKLQYIGAMGRNCVCVCVQARSDPGGCNDGSRGSCLILTPTPKPWSLTRVSTILAGTTLNRPIGAAGALQKIREPMLPYPQGDLVLLLWLHRTKWRLFQHRCISWCHLSIRLGPKYFLVLTCFSFYQFSAFQSGFHSVEMALIFSVILQQTWKF